MQSITREKPALNGFPQRETVIGTVTVDEAFSRRTVEQTACNYYEIRIDPGTYEVVRINPSGHPWIIVRYEGEIVDEHFVNRLFTASSIAEKRSIGQRSTRASAQLDEYEAARKFVSDPAWELAEDWTVTMTTFVLSDGRPHKSFKLVAPQS